jgi:C7-C12 aromatase (ARO/CYC)
VPTMQQDTVLYTATVNAPVSLVFDLVAELERWPEFHGPSVHAEALESQDGAELYQHWWVIDDHTVRSWKARWWFLRDELRINFEFTPEEPGAAASRGQFSFLALSDQSTEIRAEQTVSGAGSYDHQQAEQDLRELVDRFADAAGHHKERQDLVVDFEDPLFVAGPLDDAYRYLYEADKWPERIPHVSRLVLEEPVPNVQFFDMETQTPDGSSHTTRSVRICLPGNKIVYKQIHLPKLLDGHTGHWKFTPTREGFILAARHTATIKPDALLILGAGTTVLDARRYLRRVLSANSMSNLRLAKAYSEERTGV